MKKFGNISDGYSTLIIEAVVTYAQKKGKGVRVSDLLKNVVFKSRSTVNGYLTYVENNVSTFDRPSVRLIIDHCVKAGYLERRSSFLFFKKETWRMEESRARRAAALAKRQVAAVMES